MWPDCLECGDRLSRKSSRVNGRRGLDLATRGRLVREGAFTVALPEKYQFAPGTFPTLAPSFLKKDEKT